MESGRIGSCKRVRYKKEIRALQRYVRIRRICIALSIGFLLAAVWMTLGGF